jgi:hypothetical protein
LAKTPVFAKRDLIGGKIAKNSNENGEKTEKTSNVAKTVRAHFVPRFSFLPL